LKKPFITIKEKEKQQAAKKQEQLRLQMEEQRLQMESDERLSLALLEEE